MSDNWIVLIPTDPHFDPSAESRDRAEHRLGELLPDADEIEVIASDSIEFFDCGANLERILCSNCEAQINLDWWADRLAEDRDTGYLKTRYAMPCCKSPHSLDELIYDWPQGFARFGLSAMNPNVGELTATIKEELEAILGSELRVIYQHL